ncbi:MAG TPA: hypothetical protein VF461_04280 [Gemmatimonadaceae bacterium]
MTPAMQRVLVFALLLAAAVYLAHRGWRTWRAAVARRGTGCGPDCGCG